VRTGGDIQFKQRSVEGATPPAGTQVERLILDGQQRMTSLFQALLLDKPVQSQDVRKHPVSRWFYVGIRGALDPHTDHEETIRFLPPDRAVRNFRGEPIEDLSAPERSISDTCPTKSPWLPPLRDLSDRTPEAADSESMHCERPISGGAQGYNYAGGAA
jgi:hypothetical protein